MEEDAELNFNYSYVRLGDMPVAQSSALNERISTSDEFSNAGIHVINVSIIWRY